MTQFWRVETYRYNNDPTELFATVSDSAGSHRIRIHEFSFSLRTLTLRFHPSAGELVFRDGSVFLGGLRLEKVNGYQVNCPVDVIITARLDIAIANIAQEILPAEYFQGIPVRAETHYFDFLVSDVRRTGVPSTNELEAEYLRFSCMNGGIGIVFPTPHQHPLQCKNCRNFHGKSYGGTFLVCGIHPYGNGEDCSDFEGQES